MRRKANTNGEPVGSVLRRLYRAIDVPVVGPDHPYRPDSRRLESVAAEYSEEKLVETAMPSYTNSNHLLREIFVAPAWRSYG
jgi:hypothetical protein